MCKIKEIKHNAIYLKYNDRSRLFLEYAERYPQIFLKEISCCETFALCFLQGKPKVGIKPVLATFLILCCLQIFCQ